MTPSISLTPSRQSGHRYLVILGTLLMSIVLWASPNLAQSAAASQLNTLKLTQPEIEDLQFAAKSFKQFFANTQADTKAINLKLTDLINEQKILNTELSRLNDELKTELETQKADSKKQRKAMWITIIITGLLGVVF